MPWWNKKQTDNDNNAFKGNNDGLRSKMPKMVRLREVRRTEDMDIAQRLKNLELEKQLKERSILQERMMRMRYEDL
jgi:hypothetical protein